MNLSVLHFANRVIRTYQFQDTGGRVLLVCVLDEIEQTLASHARPRSHGVRMLCILLAAQKLAEAGDWYGLLSKPEVLLREAENATNP